MLFDEFLEACDAAPDIDQLTLSIPDDWSQGRTVFGGLSAGILLKVMERSVEASRPLQSVTFNFVGPLTVKQDFGFDVTVLREGKNATQLTASIIQDGKICLTALACYAQQRESKVQVPAKHEHSLEFPKKPNFIPQIPKVTPKFLRHVQLAIQEGKMPFTGSKQSRLSGWIRLKETPNSITDSHIVTLIDAWPPTILQMVLGPAPASTMSWNVELIHPFADVEPGQWLAYEAETIYASDGYGHTEAKIWSESGQLLALSRQLVAIFDK